MFTIWRRFFRNRLFVLVFALVTVRTPNPPRLTKNNLCSQKTVVVPKSQPFKGIFRLRTWCRFFRKSEPSLLIFVLCNFVSFVIPETAWVPSKSVDLIGIVLILSPWLRSRSFLDLKIDEAIQFWAPPNSLSEPWPRRKVHIPIAKSPNTANRG